MSKGRSPVDEVAREEWEPIVLQKRICLYKTTSGSVTWTLVMEMKDHRFHYTFRRDVDGRPHEYSEIESIGDTELSPKQVKIMVGIWMEQSRPLDFTISK